MLGVLGPVSPRSGYGSREKRFVTGVLREDSPVSWPLFSNLSIDYPHPAPVGVREGVCNDL